MSLSQQFKQVVFLWSLSDSKSSRVSKTLSSIPTDLNITVVWTVSTLPWTSSSTFYSLGYWGLFQKILS